MQLVNLSNDLRYAINGFQKSELDIATSDRYVYIIHFGHDH